MLRDARGERITVHGTRTVKMDLGSNIRAACRFTVADVEYPIMSVGKLLKGGYAFDLGSTKSTMGKGGRNVQLEVQRNSLWLPVGVRETNDHVNVLSAPTLTEFSPLALLRGRLAELYQPTYGTKKQCYDRLVVAELEEAKRQKELDWLEERRKQLEVTNVPLEPRMLAA